MNRTMFRKKETIYAMALIFGLLAIGFISATPHAAYAMNAAEAQARQRGNVWTTFYAPVEEKIKPFDAMNATAIPESHSGFRGMDVHGWIAYVHLKTIRGDVWTDRQVLWVLEQIDNPYANTWMDDGWLSR